MGEAGRDDDGTMRIVTKIVVLVLVLMLMIEHDDDDDNDDHDDDHDDFPHALYLHLCKHSVCGTRPAPQKSRLANDIRPCIKAPLDRPLERTSLASVTIRRTGL